MSVIRAVLCVAALVCLSGCVAELVEKEKPRKGPVPEVGYIALGGGEVRYSTDGWGFVVSLRRRTALRKMRKVCRGKGLVAKISDDFTRQDSDAIYSGEELSDNMQKGLEHYSVAMYRHIVFECKEAEKPLAKPGQEKKQ
ncbi:MAG: hypothetical protein HY077_02110 [Elusimicrobia bacterium]|nr:hypothetical protein [Elusimicrobiota bacterium]